MKDRGPLLSVFFVSAGILVFEVALTRIFSLTYWHHFASLLIALAMTGFGTAGSLTTLTMSRLLRRSEATLIITAMGAAAAVPLSYHLSLAAGLEPLALAWSSGAWLRLALVCLILIIPFTPAAAHIALGLAVSDRVGRLYGANLAGSAVGCLVAAGAAAVMFPHHALYLASGLMVTGSLCIPIQSASWRTVRVLTSVGLILVLWLWPLPLAFAPFKDRAVVMAAEGSRLEQSRPGLHGVTELIRGPAFHYLPGMSLGCQADLPGQSGIFVDGNLVGSVVENRLEESFPPGFVDCLLGSIPYKIFRPGKVLLINPRSDATIWPALTAEVDKLTVVEENPEIFRMLTRAAVMDSVSRRTRYIGIREDPAVFLNRTPDRYHLIFLGNGGSWEGGASGLGVTRLLTVEALIEMIDRLEPNGILVVSGPLMTPPRASLKLLMMIGDVFERLNVDASNSLVVVRDWNTVMAVIKPDGLSADDVDGIRRLAAAGSFDPAVAPGLTVDQVNRFHYLPTEPLYSTWQAILAGRSNALARESVFHIEPATRNKPYFFRFFRLRFLTSMFSDPNGYRLGATEWGMLFIYGGLAVSLVSAGIGGLAPLIRLRPLPRHPAYFCLIGLGYMMGEISLLSEAIYRIGRPALAMPLVLGVFLLCSGMGSLLWGGKKPAVFAWASAGALVASFIGLRYLPGSTWGVALVLAPAALLMGAPFAGGLTHVIGPHPAARAWAFALNCFFSVIGAQAAALICLDAGHGAAVLIAGGCYFLAGLIIKENVS
jgi:hypothetical protein